MDKNTKFTPGPWGFGKTDEGKRLILGKNGDGRYVCSIQIWQTPRNYGLDMEDEREANARLISAAPDLFEACKSCLPELFAWESFCMQTCNIEKKEKISKIINFVNSAIAKAEAE